jgi:hypothetical protein
MPPTATTHASGTNGVAILVDFDNFYPGDRAELSQPWLIHQVNRMTTLAVERCSEAERLDIRLYGGWLDEGVLTNRASALQSAVAAMPLFPTPHPLREGLLRGSIELVTRLVAVPSIEWGHTRRVQDGLPRLRLAESPLPLGCKGDLTSCPLRTVHRFSLRSGRTCHIEGCAVQNREAFRVIEQKMVDILIACDAMALAAADPPLRVFVMSDDLDVVPAVAMASYVSGRPVNLVRTSVRAQQLYGDDLLAVGVELEYWQAA